MSLVPSPNIDPTTLYAKLKDRKRPFVLVDFPARAADEEQLGQVAVRILTQEEQMASTKAAEDLARKHLKDAKKDDLGYERLFADAYCVELLHRACRDPNDQNRPLFPSAEEIRRTLTVDECGKLFEHYLTVQVELGPIVSRLTDEELEAWIDRLVEGGSAFPFDLLSSDLQRILLLHMAFQLRNSPTASDSAGSPDASDPGEPSSAGPIPTSE